MRVICEYQSYAEEHIMRDHPGDPVPGRRGTHGGDRARDGLRAQGSGARSSTAWRPRPGWSAKRSRRADIVVFPGIQMLLRSLERREAQELRSRFLPLESNFPAIARGSGASRRCRATSAPCRRIGESESKSVNSRAAVFLQFAEVVPPCPIFRSTFNFPGRLVFVGFGSIGQGVLPLVLRHIGIKTERITIVTGGRSRQARVAASTASSSSVQPLTRDNFRRVLDPLHRPWRFPAEPVGRRVEHRADQVLPREGRAVSRYLHRALAGRLHRPDDSAVAAHQLRAARRSAGAAQTQAHGPTAVITHGANPGLVSHFVKQALLNIAADTGVDAGTAGRRAKHWGQLAHKLGVKVIHIAERDTQVAIAAEGARRIRQHLVGRRLRQRRLAAGRARLGHAREELPARRPALRLRPRQRDLPDAAGRRARACAPGRRRPGISTAS